MNKAKFDADKVLYRCICMKDGRILSQGCMGEHYHIIRKRNDVDDDDPWDSYVHGCVVFDGKERFIKFNHELCLETRFSEEYLPSWLLRQIDSLYKPNIWKEYARCKRSQGLY